MESNSIIELIQWVFQESPKVDGIGAIINKLEKQNKYISIFNA